MVNATNYTKPSVNPTGYGIRNISTDALLLQNGDYLLLQNGGKLLLGKGELKTTNYTKPTINATNYTK